MDHSGSSLKPEFEPRGFFADQFEVRGFFSSFPPLWSARDLVSFCCGPVLRLKDWNMPMTLWRQSSQTTK